MRVLMLNYKYPTLRGGVMPANISEESGKKSMILCHAFFGIPAALT